MASSYIYNIILLSWQITNTYLLKDELKNVAGPNAYALIAISNMKAHKNTNSA